MFADLTWIETAMSRFKTGEAMMTVIGSISGPRVGQAGQYERPAARGRLGGPPETRLPVAVRPVANSEAETPARHRPTAPFLAQLLATKNDLPQARERRRAEPAEAVAAYTAALGLVR
jgi:hypothetical protein